jgi:hypothetical protein
MRHLPIRTATIVSALLALTLTAWAVRVGDPAPDFTGTDSNGQTHKLSEYRGKYVVLEWTNNGCPTPASTTPAATCKTSRSSGPPKASFGLPSSPPHPDPRAT